MSDAPKPSIMDRQIVEIKDANVEATIYLKNGIKLGGKIIDFDREFIHLTCSGNPHGMVIDRTALSSLQRASSKDSSTGGNPSRKQ